MLFKKARLLTPLKTIPDGVEQPYVTPATSQPGRLGWILLGLPLLFVALLLLPRLVAFFDHSLRAVAYPYQLDYDEGFNLSAAWQWAQGVNIYLPNTPNHFITAAYPPLYYLLNATILKTFGLSLAGGRWLSFVASLTCAGLTGLLCYQLLSQFAEKQARTLKQAIAIVAALAWLVLAPTYIWSTLYKQDMVGLALALAGLYLTASQSKRGWWVLLPATLLLGLAVLTKQNLLTALGAACLYTLLLNWRRGLIWLLLLLGLLFIGWGLLDLYSRGGAYNHIIATQADVGWSGTDVMRLLLPIFRDHWLLIALSAFYLVMVGVDCVQQHRLKLPLGVCYLLSCGGELLTLGATGSNYNHALVFFPALLITAGAGFVRLLQLVQTIFTYSWRQPLFAIIMTVLLGLQFGLYVSPQAYSLAGDINAFNATAHQVVNQDIERSSGLILSDDIQLVLANGRPLAYDSLFHSNFAASKGQWDDSQLTSAIANRRFALILLGHDSLRLTPGGQIALQNSYKLAKLSDLDEWVPLERPLQALKPVAACFLNEPQTGQPQIELKGYSFGLQAPTLNSTLTLTTYWTAVAPPTHSYQLFIHLVDKQGVVVAQRDDVPGNEKGLVPTTSWQANSNILVDQNLPLPAHLSSGEYYLQIGAYYATSSNIAGLQPNPGCSLPINQFNQFILDTSLHF